MTAGNNGADTPENEDPFAYLYRSDGEQPGANGTGGAPRTGGYGYPGPGTPQQPGVPRRSYNQVRAVGERSYGQQYAGQQPGHGPTQGYGGQSAHYAAPETLSGAGGAGASPGSPAGPRSGGRGPNNKGLLISAIAVVAVVVIGIAAVMIANGGGDDKKAEDDKQPTAGPTPSESADQPSTKPSTSESPPELPEEDAASLRLQGGAVTARDVPGAESGSGTYVTGLDKPGASATWTMDVPDEGSYRLNVLYGVPGEDRNLTLTVNGKKLDRPITMDNFAHAKKGDWEHGWTNSFSIVQLDKGTNTVTLSCEEGNDCGVNLDQVSISEEKDGD